MNNVFKNKNFVLTFLGTLVSNVGNTFYNFAISFYILSLTNNNSITQGLYIFITSLVFVLTSLFSGVLADRYNKVKIMYLSDYLKGALIILALILCLAFKENSAQVTIIFVIGALTSFIGAIFSSSSGALLPEIIDGDQIQQAESYFSILGSFQSIFGILLAGVFFSILNMYQLFLLVGICYILSGVSEMFIKNNYQKPIDKLTFKKTFIDMGEGFKYLNRDKALFMFIFIFVFINFFITPISDNFISYFIETTVKNSPSGFLFDKLIDAEFWTSIFSIAFGLGSLITGFVLSIKKQKEHISKVVKINTLIIASLASIISLAYYLFIERTNNLNIFLVSFTIIFGLTGVCITNTNVPMSTLLLTRVDKDKIGKVNSFVNVACMGLSPIAAVLAGIMIKKTGVLSVLIMSCVGLLISSLFLLFNKKSNEL